MHTVFANVCFRLWCLCIVKSKERLQAFRHYLTQLNFLNFFHTIYYRRYSEHDTGALINFILVPDTPSKTAQVEMPFFCTEEGRYLASCKIQHVI